LLGTLRVTYEHPIVAVLPFTPLAFVLLWLGLRWPLRYAILASNLLGLVADALFDVLVTRAR
jgi:hypothetical protein